MEIFIAGLQHNFNTLKKPIKISEKINQTIEELNGTFSQNMF